MELAMPGAHHGRCPDTAVVDLSSPDADRDFRDDAEVNAPVSLDLTACIVKSVSKRNTQDQEWQS
jgi:hypothetical protein